MWLEVKAAITLIGCAIIGICLGLTGNLIIAVIALMGIGTIIFGDVLIGWKIVSTQAILALDPNAPGERTIDLFLIGGGRQLAKGKKGMEGKIEFLYNKQPATVIDTGKYPTHWPNGNLGVVAHETYDKTIDLYELEALNLSSQELEADDIKGMREMIMDKREKNKEKKKNE